MLRIGYRHGYANSHRTTAVPASSAYCLYFSYVSAMVPVKTMKEYDMAQDVTVLFSETVNR